MHGTRSGLAGRGRFWRSYARQNALSALHNALWVLGALLVAVGVWLDPFGLNGDVSATTPLRQAEGRVTDRFFTSERVTWKPHHYSQLTVDGRLLLAEERYLASGQRARLLPDKGRRVRYRYRVGKSGRWYLYDAEPPSSGR